jgi:hypothetical protein
MFSLQISIPGLAHHSSHGVRGIDPCDTREKDNHKIVFSVRTHPRPHFLLRSVGTLDLQDSPRAAVCWPVSSLSYLPMNNSAVLLRQRLVLETHTSLALKTQVRNAKTCKTLEWVETFLSFEGSHHRCQGKLNPQHSEWNPPLIYSCMHKAIASSCYIYLNVKDTYNSVLPLGSSQSSCAK